MLHKDELTVLLKRAVEFYDLSPWDWLNSSDIFGVKNPFSGEIEYCAVLGNDGQFYALLMHHGTEGLEGFLKIVFGNENDLDSVFDQNCLVVSYEPSKFLHPADKKLLRRVPTLKFQPGGNPTFQTHVPGYRLKNNLTDDQYRLVSIVLEQALDVCKRSEHERDLLHKHGENIFLVRVCQGNMWHDEYLEPEPIEKKEIIPVALNQFLMQKVKNKFNPQGSFEFDSFYLYTPVKGKNNGFFPYCYLMADAGSGIVTESVLDEVPEFDSLKNAGNFFLQILDKNNLFPEKLILKKEDLKQVLAPVLIELGINSELRKELPMIYEFRKELKEQTAPNLKFN